MDKVIGVMETRAHLRELLKKVAQGQRFIITQRSHPRAVLMSPEEVETLEISADKKLLEDLKIAKLEIQRHRARPWKKYLKAAKRKS